MKLIVLDTETGGIGDDKSLLTAYFMVVEGEKILDELYLYTKPNEGGYVVTAEALDINKINLIEHDKKALTYKQAGTELYKFLLNNSNAGAEKLVPLGHNVNFDIEFIWDKLIGRSTWETFVGYRKLDTGTISQFLIESGKLPVTLTASLGKLAEYFKVCNPTTVFHDAKDDTLMTWAVYKKLRTV